MDYFLAYAVFKKTSWQDAKSIKSYNHQACIINVYIHIIVYKCVRTTLKILKF